MLFHWQTCGRVSGVTPVPGKWHKMWADLSTHWWQPQSKIKANKKMHSVPLRGQKIRLLAQHQNDIRINLGKIMTAILIWGEKNEEFSLCRECKIRFQSPLLAQKQIALIFLQANISTIIFITDIHHFHSLFSKILFQSKKKMELQTWANVYPNDYEWNRRRDVSHRP